MAFDVVMFGSVSVPEAHVETWLTTPIEASEFPWLDEVSGSDFTADTPEALLTLLREQSCFPHELMRVELVESYVTAQCFASEDLYRDTKQALALLFASTAAFSGVGELHFSGYRGIRFAERLTVRGGRSTFTALDTDDAQKLEQHPSFVKLDAKIHERYDTLVGRPTGTPIDPRKSQWVIHPFTGRRVRVELGS